MKQWLSSLLLCLFPLLGLCAPWDNDSITALFAGRDLDAIEGVWQFPNDGAKMLITRASATTFDIVLLDSPRLDIRPGVNIGQAIITPTRNTYDARLDNKPLGSNKIGKSTTTFTITAEGMLRIKPYSQGWSVSLKRWIPYFFRISIKEASKPEGLTGAIRVYPTTFKPIL